MKKVWRAALMLMALLTLCCARENGVQAKKKNNIKVKKVTVKSNFGSSVHVGVGKKVKITSAVKVTPNKAANRKVTYKSSKKSVATVSSAGYVKGVKAGKCKITVTSKKNKKKKAKISVQVVQQVRKLELSEKELALFAGDSEKLKFEITPASGSYYKVRWTTSDKNVATVSSSGLVTGVGPGNATIKAISVEGSNKSASCKVRVMSADTVNIDSVQVISGCAVRVTLDRAKTLTAENFVVDAKRYASGNYNRKCNVVKLRNYDNKSYDLTLDSSYVIVPDSFVRVSVASLPGNGTKTMEAQAVFVKNSVPPDENWIGLQGEPVNRVVDLSDYCYGNIAYTVTGDISGVTYRQDGNALIFSGNLTDVTPGTVMTIRAVDEMDSGVSLRINVCVGDASTVAACAENMKILTGDRIKNVKFACAAGGSGKYTYAAVNLPPGLTMNGDGCISGTTNGVGEYTVQLTVTDKADTTRTATATAVIRVAEQKRITGKVTDESGAAVAGAAVVCVNADDGTRYEAKTDNEGSYDVYVAEGSYDICISFAERTDSVYNVPVGSGGRQIDFVIPAPAE